MNSRTQVPEFVAHRGSSFLAPENTLAALALGWEETDTCEVDIHATREGRLVVIHDGSTLRTTGVDFLVAERTLSELQGLDAGSWKGAAWAGERLPSLEEAIAAMPAGKRLLVEIKAGAEVVPELARVVRASGKEKQVMLHGFELGTCAAARAALPEIYVALLIAFDEEAGAAALDEAIRNAREAGLSGINTNDVPLLETGVGQIHAAGLSVYVWTVDEPVDAERLIGWGVDGLITNRPAWLRSQIASCPAARDPGNK
jgi:glycerophosphoryl diester phosphodiesterase